MMQIVSGRMGRLRAVVAAVVVGLLAPLATASAARADTPPPEDVFVDVSRTPGSPVFSVFGNEIAWMAEAGITYGWARSDGTAVYRPHSPVTREQMAAFLYRFAGSPAMPAIKSSPFFDVHPSAVFLDEMNWMWSTGLSRGWTVSEGVRYAPTSLISREQMAAFLYRAAGSPEFVRPETPSFLDVSPRAAFATEIEWLAQAGISRGWVTPDGRTYHPASPITRGEMAAFLYRMNAAGLIPDMEPGPKLRHSALYVYGASTLNLRSGAGTEFDVAQTASTGTLLRPTGTTDGAWIQLRADDGVLWARSDYLVGRGGGAVSRVTSRHSNGAIPAGERCSLSWAPSETLLCEAAFDLEMLNMEFRATHGMDIPVNDSYRDFARQVLFKEIYGYLAATPGTSNHGWGLAIDIATSRLPGGTSGEAYAWLTEHLGVYNWVHPTWARLEGSKPEAWHFEYTG